MTVTFEIEVAPYRFVSEQDLNEKFAELKPALAGAERLLGTVYIADETRGASVVLYDEIEALVTRLCLNGSGQLAAGADVDFELFAEDGHIQIKIEGAEAVVFEDDAESARFTRADLISTLFDCGQRYVALMEKALAGASDSEMRLAMLKIGAKKRDN